MKKLTVPTQENELIGILLQNKTIVDILERALELNLPNWYLGAGAVAQTIWNYKSNLDLNHGIEDYDLVYFAANLADGEQTDLNMRAKKLFSEVNVDFVNQATVHLWYKNEFGKEIQPYISTESAINTWPTTSTSIGVTMDSAGSLKIYAPFGLDDLFSLTVRANKILITENIYYYKAKKWKSTWNQLNIIPW